MLPASASMVISRLRVLLILLTCVTYPIWENRNCCLGLSSVMLNLPLESVETPFEVPTRLMDTPSMGLLSLSFTTPEMVTGPCVCARTGNCKQSNSSGRDKYCSHTRDLAWVRFE